MGKKGHQTSPAGNPLVLAGWCVSWQSGEPCPLVAEQGRKKFKTFPNIQSKQSTLTPAKIFGLWLGLYCPLNSSSSRLRWGPSLQSGFPCCSQRLACAGNAIVQVGWQILKESSSYSMQVYSLPSTVIAAQTMQPGLSVLECFNTRSVSQSFIMSPSYGRVRNLLTVHAERLGWFRFKCGSKASRRVFLLTGRAQSEYILAKTPVIRVSELFVKLWSFCPWRMSFLQLLLT